MEISLSHTFASNGDGCIPSLRRLNLIMSFFGLFLPLFTCFLALRCIVNRGDFIPCSLFNVCITWLIVSICSWGGIILCYEHFWLTMTLVMFQRTTEWCGTSTNVNLQFGYWFTKSVNCLNRFVITAIASLVSVNAKDMYTLLSFVVKLQIPSQI